MRRIQSGFTLIELVMVIVIIGILAVIAIPKYIDLSGQANQAAVNGVAGALASASAINFAAHVAGSASAASVGNCTDVGPLLQGGLNANYAITSAAVTAGSTVTCTVTGPSPAVTTASFSATGV